MSTEDIPVAGPWITEKEEAYVADAVRNGWYGNANKWQERFEAAFAEHLGVRHAVCLPSATSGLHLAMAAIGLGPGDEVIIPDNTWIATAAPATHLGATPVFADIEQASWCLSPEAVEARITPRTRALVPVDLYGCVADMDRLRAIAERHGLAIIEDAAQAIGARYAGRPAGSFGTIGVFSFHGTKTMTSGEGGMLVTDDVDLHRRVLKLRAHGADRSTGKMFWHDEVAHKYRMSDMQAALGVAQLERLDELVARKRAIFALYRRYFADIPGVTLNPEPPKVEGTYWMVTAVFDRALGLAKEEIIDFLAARGIHSRPFFYPLSSMPAYEGVSGIARSRAENRCGYDLSARAVNLPSGHHMHDESKVARVAEAVRALVADRPRAAAGPRV